MDEVTKDKEVFIGIDPGHCCGWGIVENIGSAPHFVACGTIPVYAAEEQVYRTWLFWKELLEEYAEYKIWICTELNIGVAYATSVFFVKYQAMSGILILLLDQMFRKYDLEFLDIRPSDMAKHFGVKNQPKKKKREGQPQVRTSREIIRDKVQVQYGLDRSALNKSLDAWDGLVVSQVGYYIRCGRKEQYMYVVGCKLCGDRFVATLRYSTCSCGAVTAVKGSTAVRVVLWDKKKGPENVVVLAISEDVVKGENIQGIVDVVPFADLEVMYR